MVKVNKKKLPKWLNQEGVYLELKGTKNNQYISGEISLINYGMSNCQTTVIAGIDYLHQNWIDEEEIIDLIAENSFRQILIDVSTDLKKKILDKIAKYYPKSTILIEQEYENPTGSNMTLILINWDIEDLHEDHPDHPDNDDWY